MRLIAIVLVVAVLAGCVPASPTPDPVEVISRGFGDAVGCSAVLDGDPGAEGGPFVSSHQFPRLKASNANYTPSDANADLLDSLAYFDIVEFVADRHNWYANGCASIETATYLRSANPNIKLFGLWPSYGFADASPLDAVCNPNITGMFTAYDTADLALPESDWYMLDEDGEPIAWGDPGPTANQVVLNWSGLQDSFPVTNSLASWWADTVDGAAFSDAQCGGADCWHGVVLGAAGVPHQYQGNLWDIDEKGDNDFEQVGMGRAGVNDAQYDGWIHAFDAISDTTSLVIMTDGGWEPNPTGFDDTPALAGYVDIAQDYAWPTSITYLNTCGGSVFSLCPTGPTTGRYWDFHMRQYVEWMDNGGTEGNSASYVNAMTDYDTLKVKNFSASATWGDYIEDYRQYQRFLLGSTLLDNGYAQVHAGQTPDWCDECGVNLATGWSEESLTVTGWLGCPTGDARTIGAVVRYTLRDLVTLDWDTLSNYVWQREFTNGLVVVNPTTSSRTVNVGNGWRRIYSPEGAITHNNGSVVVGNLTIPAMDAFVLVRDNLSTPTPFVTWTPTQTPTVTPTPTASPTWTPGGPTATPTPTSTSTPTVTPTSTGTPTRTPTSTPTSTGTSTPTSTATATATPLSCSALSITVDGSLADWGAATPIVLNAGNAAYLAPAATPSAADLSGQFWVSCQGEVVVVGGVISDTVVITPTMLPAGDAALTRIDGLDDGIVRPGQDDHDFYIGADGRILDFNRPPTGTTVVARITPGSRWQFEASLPWSSIWSGLDNGDIIRLVFGLYDRDTTATPGPDQVMISGSRRLRLPTATPTPTP